MADESLDILIRTQADTSGVSQAADAVKKLTNETERYQEALQRMAAAQAMAERSGGGRPGSDDAAMLAKAERHKQAVAEARERKAYEEQANAEIAASYHKVTKEEAEAALAAKDFGKKGKEANDEAGEAADKATEKHKELKEGIKGVGMVFPELGHLGHLVLHPITLLVTAIVGAFSIWKLRVESLTSALAGLKLPDWSDSTVSKVSAQAEAYHKLADAVRDSAEKFTSASAAHERYVKTLQAEAEALKAILAANKARDLAVLESKRAAGEVSDSDYARRKNAIEGSYAAAGLKADMVTEQQILADKEKRRNDLMAEAERKRREAAAIHLPSEADADKEARLDDVHKQNREAAEQAKKEAQARLDMIRKAERPWDVASGAAYIKQYGYMNTEEAVAIEDENIRQANEVIARENARDRQKYERERLKKRRAQLNDQAAAAAAEATEIDLSLPEEKRLLQRKQAAQTTAAAAEDQARRINLGTEQQGTALGREILRAAELVKRAMESGKGVGALSEEEQGFLAGMNQRYTGATRAPGGRAGAEGALKNFSGAGAGTDRFSEVYGRMSDVAALKQDEATAKAILAGQQVSEAARRQMSEHARMLGVVENSITAQARALATVVDRLETLNKAIEAMQTQLNRQAQSVHIPGT